MIVTSGSGSPGAISWVVSRAPITPSPEITTSVADQTSCLADSVFFSSSRTQVNSRIGESAEASRQSLADLMFSIAGQISSGKLTDKAATQSFIETIGKDPDHWLEAPSGPLSTAWWDLWFVVTGLKEGRRGRYTYWLTSFGYPPLIVAALCIMRGDVSVRGVLPPEACFEPQSFFDEVVSLMPEPPVDRKLFGESFEWLE